MNRWLYDWSKPFLGVSYSWHEARQKASRKSGTDQHFHQRLKIQARLFTFTVDSRLGQAARKRDTRIEVKADLMSRKKKDAIQ